MIEFTRINDRKGYAMSAQQGQDSLQFALGIFSNQSKQNRAQIAKNIMTGMDMGAILMQVELAREFDEAVKNISQGRDVELPPITTPTTENLNNLNVHTDDEYQRWRNDYEREMELYQTPIV